MKRSLNIAATFLAGLGCSMQLETVTDSDRLVDVLKCGWVVTSESLTPPADSVEAACWRFTPANRTAIVLTSDHLGACDLPKEGHRVIVVPSETSVTYWATVGRADSGVDTHMDSIECPVTQGAGS